MTSPLRILVLVPGAPGGRAAGPEIRAWELARALAADHPVTAVVRRGAVGWRDGVRVVRWTRRAILREVLRHDAVLSGCLPPFVLAVKPVRPFVAISDQYDPLENELALLDDGRYRDRELRAAVAARELQLRHADLVLCAAERQREALLQVWPDRAGAPPPLVVPFGLPPAPLPPRGRPLRERFSEIAQDDTLVLWWGSIWRWLDAATAIRAVAGLSSARPDVKLVITAGRPPGPGVERFAAVDEARGLARTLGVLDRTVFFLDEWVPYERRHELLADADIGITLPLDAAEARLAARARYMDYLWAGLPCVLGRGDEAAEELAAAGFATLVEPGDRAATAAALLALADDPSARAAAREAGARLADERRWPAVASRLGDALEALAPPCRQAPSRATVDLLQRSVAYYGAELLARMRDAAAGWKDPRPAGVDPA